jgi:hypothetical protein
MESTFNNRSRSRNKFKKPSSSNWPVTYRLVAIGTLVAYTAFGATNLLRRWVDA